MVVLVFILLFISHRQTLTLCLGFYTAKAPCRPRLSNSRREFSVLISFIRLGLSLSLSLPGTTQPGPTLRCDAKLSWGLTQYSLTLSLSPDLALQWMLRLRFTWQHKLLLSPGWTENWSIQNISSSATLDCTAGSVGQYTWQQISQYARTSILTGPVLTPLTPDKLPSVKSILARK